MKQRFTKLLAAVALLVFMMPSLAGWGQTYSLTPDKTSTGLNNTSYITSLTEFTWEGVSWKMNQWNPSTLQVRTNQSSATSEFRFYNTSAFSGRITQVVITFSALTVTDASKLMFLGGTSEVSATTGGTAGTWNSTNKTLTWTPGASDNFTYFAFYQNGKAASGTNYLEETDAIVVTFETGGTPVCATPTFSPAAGAVVSGTTVSISSTEGSTIYYTTNGENPTINSNEYSDPIEIAEATTIKAFAVKEGYNDSEIATAEYTIKTIVTGYNIDFESDLDCYENWDFTNIGIHTTGLTNGAHGGQAWGANVNSNNNGVETAIIKTKEKVAYPDVFTCYISKESGNTTASSWEIQVSSDGSSWNDIATLTSMTQNTWKEFTGDIKAAGYTDVYVRLYYNGSSAIRAVDDISLTTYTPAAVEEPVITVTNPFTISTSVSITCVTEGATIYYTTDGNDPTTNSNVYSEPFTINSTTTIKALAVKGDDESTIAEVTAVKELATPTVEISTLNIVIDGTATVTTNGPTVTLTTSDASIASVSGTTVTGLAVGTATITASWSENSDYSAGTKDFSVVVTDPNASGSQNNPYSVAQARAAIDAGSGVENVHVAGVVCTGGSLNSGSITYWISDDGTETNKLQVYKGKGINGANFQSSDDIKVGDNVVVYGTLSKYNSIYQFNNGNYLVSLEHPTYNVSFALDGGIFVPNEDFETTTVVLQSGTYTLPSANKYGYTFEGWNDGTNTYSAGDEYVLNADVSFTAQWVYGTSTSGTIVFGNNGTKINAASVTGDDSNGNTWTITTVGTTSFTQNTDYSQVGSGSKPASSITFTTTLPQLAKITVFSAKFGGFSDTAGTVTLKVGETEVGTGSLDGTNDVTVSSTVAETGTVLTVTVTNIAKGVKCYNISYSYEEIPYVSINGHGGNAGNWYLIASPLTQDMAPAAINGLVAADEHYDLYRFNQNPTVTNENDYLEWENYKIHTNGFVLENGKGYLYASQTSTTLYFNGECNTGDTKTVDLDYSETNPDVNMHGWNLVGNPFTTVAYANHSYFVMDGNGTSIVAEPVSSSTAINPFTGVFVQATATGQSVIFSKTAPSTTNNKGVINLALSQQVNRGSAMVDKAVVSFNAGDQLGKFVFMESNAKLYIPKNGKDYAIAVAEGKGEMPVNFKAQENGTYTLNIDTENVEMNYLHLIDNMTGMDVDLLQTPSYTFDATTNDYASRFRLVFSANDVNEQNAETFAFFSNGNWVVNNEGEATLQVIDVNGRIVSNETINGTVATSINATPGVYMLRLVNGNEVKTQKIVVR